MAGGVLIEHAVQISDEEWGAEGRLELMAENKDACAAYKCLGFEGETGPEDDEMILDPSRKPEIWKKIKNKWRLKKYHGLKYIG